MLEAIAPHAAIISAGSALISAVAVLISTWFIIWTTYFRKTRRDKIDELKVEMQVKLSQGWSRRVISGTHTIDQFIQSLDSKFRNKRYKGLHQCAYDDLSYEGKNDIVNYHIGMREERHHRNSVLAQNYANRRSR